MKFHVVPATWDEARLRCHAEGAVLASPLNNDLKAAIVSFVKQQRDTIPCTIFSGVHATFSQGDYSSVEGVPLLRLAVTWAPGEPNNYKNSERCLVMMINGNGIMADARCGDVYPYVCFKKDTQLNLTACGTTDPEYTLDPRTGSCYKFHTSGLIWSQAYMTCVAEGGYLAIINNDLEAAVIKEMFAKHPENSLGSIYKGSLAVGVHDWGNYGRSFMTIHGESLDAVYNKWSSGEPDNVTLARAGDYGQYCGSVFRNAQYDDVYCSVALAFLCEKNPNSLHSWSTDIY